RIDEVQIQIEHQNDREDHRGRSDDCGSNQYRLRRGFERISSGIVFFEKVFALFEVRSESEITLNIGFHIWNRLNLREFKNGLSVISHRAVRVDGNSNRTHSEHSERHETEGKNFRINHETAESLLAHPIGEEHQTSNGHSFPEGREVSSDQS